MIPNISTGTKMVGLVQYLAGPGRANEHTDMHVVCASDLVVSVDAGQALVGDVSLALGRELDLPRKTFQPHDERASVFHASLSLGPDEGPKDDAFWADVVREFMDEMGFDGSDGKTPARWVAIRHGVSKNGNDHVHIAASMVREDGTRWSQHNNYVKAQRIARRLEEKHGLRVVGQGVKTRGYAEGEAESVARRRAAGKYAAEAKMNPGMVPWARLARGEREAFIAQQVPLEQPRVDVMLRVRAATAGSRDEGEFVRRMRGAGLLVRPYYVKGGAEQVSGYSVAGRPIHGERPIWYGGGTLAKDLTLAALRTGWNDAGQADAVGEWKAAAAGRRPVSKDPVKMTPESVRAYFDDLNGYLHTLSETSIDNPVKYAQIAREGAGLFASWSIAATADGDDNAQALQQAAKLLARHAQLSERPARAVRSLSSPAMDMATHIAIAKSSRVGAAAVIRSWSTLGKQLGNSLAARGWAQNSRVLVDDLGSSLDQVHASYKSVQPAAAPVPEKAPRAGTVTAATPGGPVLTAPPRLQDARVAREAQLAALEKKMREAGAPEAGIKAAMFAARQQGSNAPTATSGKDPGSNISRGPGKTDSPRQNRGPEKGTRR